MTSVLNPGYIVAKNSMQMARVVRTLQSRIVRAVGRAIPPATKEIAELVVAFQIAEINALMGSKNKTHRPNKSTHMKLADSLFVIQKRSGPTQARYEIITRAPHAMWAELGSRTDTGLPWSTVKGKEARDYSHTAFTGYNALRRGLNKARNIQNGRYKRIIGIHLRNQISKIRP